MKRFDIVLIGSGISALTAALILARRGKSVCVLEQYVKPGGYLHSFSRFGHRYETGSHYVGGLSPGQNFRVLLEWLGVYDDSLFVPLDDRAFDVFEFPEFSFEFPKGYEAFRENLLALAPEDGSGVDSFLKLVQETVVQFPTYRFNADYDDRAVAASLNRSLHDVVCEHIRSPRLKSVLFGHCALHGTKAVDIAFGLHALVLDSMLQGAYGFRLGGDALAKRYVERIVENGGEVRTRARVKRLHTHDRHVTSVELDSGERIESEWVISSAHPKATFRLLDDTQLSPAFRSRLKKLRESPAVFGVYASVSRSDLVHPLRNYYFFPSAEPEELFAPPRLGARPGVMYASCPKRDATGVGETPLTLHSPIAHEWFAPWTETRWSKRPSDYHAFKNQIAEELFDFLEERRPGARQAISRYEASSSLTNLHFNGSEDGSAYGLYHSFEITGARALGPRTHVTNLLLTGQSCLLPGLLSSAIAGLRSAGALVGIKPLIRELGSWAQ